MNVIPVSFGAWEPDRATFMSDALVDACNVVPVAGGYGPDYSFSPTTAQLALPIKGATELSDDIGAVYVYAGSGNSVYVSPNGAAFASKYTSGSSLTALYRWQFVRFVGNVIGVHPQIAPASGVIGQTMSALGGSPPTAKVAGVVGNFLVLGDLLDGAFGTVPRRIRWSGFRNPTAWGTSTATQADFNDMPDEGGIVQGIVGREFGTVFQRYSISRMTYVGPPTVFQFDVVEKKRGAISAGSIIDAGLLAAYIADDGFFLWDGTSSTPIGAGRINEYFRRRLYPSSENYIVGMFDPLMGTVSWAYRTDGTGLLTERLIYSLTENRWSRSDVTSAWLMSGFDSGYTLEGLDAFGTLDSLTFSLDDPKLVGGRVKPVGFDGSGYYGTLSGTTLPAKMETGDWQSMPGQRSFVNGVRPLIDAASVTCAVGTRLESMADGVSYTSDAVKVGDGTCPLRASGRYVRARVNIAGMQTWTRATGIEVSVAAEGRR